LKAHRRATRAILDVLAYESDVSDPAETDAKIQRALRHRLIRYRPSQDAVDTLRSLRRELVSELSRGKQSDYFVDSRGRYAREEDFDLDRLTRDTAARYPDVPVGEIRRFVRWIAFLCWVK
jgi:hypothetical protein